MYVYRFPSTMCIIVYNPCIAQQHSASSWWSVNASWLLILVGGNFSSFVLLLVATNICPNYLFSSSSCFIWLFYWSFIWFLFFLVFEKSEQRPMRFNVWFYKGTWLWRFYGCSHLLILCLIWLSTHYYFRKRRIQFSFIAIFTSFVDLETWSAFFQWFVKKWRRTINNMDSY